MLTAQGNQTQVVLDITSGPSGVGAGAHIYAGPCPGVGAVKYSLIPPGVVNGKLTLVVNATLNSLLDGNSVINVHQSEAESNIYTSGGKIPAVTP